MSECPFDYEDAGHSPIRQWRLRLDASRWPRGRRRWSTG